MIIFLGRVVISLAILGFVLHQASPKDIFASLAQVGSRWPLLALPAALPGIGILIAATRWSILLGAVGIHMRLYDLAKALCIGSFFNSFLPSTLSGDIVRSWWINRPDVGIMKSAAVVAVDRLIGLATLSLIAGSIGLLHPAFLPTPARYILGASTVGCVTALLLLPFIPKQVNIHRTQIASLLTPLIEKIQGFTNSVLAFRHAWKRIVIALMLSALLHLVIVTQYLAMASILQLEIPFAEFALLIPLVTAVSLLPITINGIGVRETALGLLGAPIGLALADAVALAWLALFFSLIYAGAGAVILSVSRRQQAAELVGSPGVQ